MAQPNFDYEGALNAGYSEDEIKGFLSQNQSNPQEKKPSTQDVGNMFEKIKNFDYQGAIDSGYSPDEITEFLKEQKPERSNLEQAGRIGGQFAMGAIESAAMPYEIPLAISNLAGVQSKGAQVARTRDMIADDVENMLMKKATGDWTREEEEELEGLRELWKNPEKIEKEITHEPMDLSVRGLTEQATGLDLKPEGFLEKAANWMGFLKNIKLPNMAASGISAKDVAKAIAPSGTDVLRGIGAGAALELAEDGEFGPIGTMAAVIVGDVAGGGTAAVLKGAKNVVTNPKKAIAETIAAFTPKDKLDLQKQVIKDFRDAGIQADLGSITDSNLIKMTQARLSQSGLTGKALQEFRDGLTTQIKEEYKALADSLGEAKHASTHEDI